MTSLTALAARDDAREAAIRDRATAPSWEWTDVRFLLRRLDEARNTPPSPRADGVRFRFYDWGNHLWALTDTGVYLGRFLSDEGDLGRFL